MQKETTTTEQLPLEAPGSAPTITGKAPTIPELAESIKAEIVEPSAMVAAGVTSTGYALEVATISSLERARELGEIYRVEAELLQTLNRSAIAATDPSDWVLMKDKSGTATGFLRAAGCRKAAVYFGLHIYNQGPIESGEFRPRRITGEDGEYAYEAYCDIYSRRLHCTVEGVHFRVSNRAGFTGRSAAGAVGLIADGDLLRSCETGLNSRAIRMITGYGRVSVETLKACGLDTDQAAKGSGYGSSAGRQANAASGDLAGEKKRLQEEMARRGAGGADVFYDVLKDITSWKDKSSGEMKWNKSIDEIGFDWKLEQSFKRLAEHPVYGDAAMKEGGSS